MMRRRSDVVSNNNATFNEVVEYDSLSISLSQQKKCISRFYVMHMALVVGVLVLGMVHNVGNKKYIPVNAKDLHKQLIIMRAESNNSSSTVVEDDPDEWKDKCNKAYINVHSASVDDELAAICCNDHENDTTIHHHHAHSNHLCNPRLPIIGTSIQLIPFAKRLTRLTEAWVLPLLPILIRLVCQVLYALSAYYKRRCKNIDNQRRHNTAIIQREATSISSYSPRSTLSSVSQTSSSTSLEKIVIDTSVPSPLSSTEVIIMSSAASHKYNILTTLKRLLFYFLLLNFRGWGLYIGANALEDFVFLPWFTGNTVTSPLRTDSLSDVEHDIHYKGSYQPQCWYEGVLKSHHKLSMETQSECYGRPFDFSDHVVLFLAHYLPVFVMEMIFCYRHPFWKKKSSTPNKNIGGGCWFAIHVFLFLYLHVLVLHATYQTALYFHTRGEIIVGYLVSLIVQLPVCYLMCSDECTRLKEVLGIQEASSLEEKSD